MDENNITMADLMAEIDKSMTRIYRGDILKAKVVLIQEQGVVVNIGYHTDGLITWNEFSYDEVDRDSIKMGDEFEVTVLKIDDGEGNVLVSKRRAEAQTALEDIQELFDKKEKFTVRIKDVVKGGVVAPVKGLRAFIPGSQLSNTYVEDLSKYVGQEVEVEIIEFVPKTKKIVLSGKKIAAERAQAAKKQRLEELVEGEKYTGVITKLMPYGVFVDLGGVDGLIHNNDLSWVKIKHPSDVVKEGQKVEVTLLALDKETGKVSLRLKDITMDPWYLETVNLEKDQIVPVTVTRFTHFGAFASINGGIEGLIHISQISEKRIQKPEEVLEIGQQVKAKILNIDKDAKKISLSLKEVQEKIDPDMLKYMNQEEEGAKLGDVLGNVF
ncbi:30S ribosomal protein S1 [Cellulosilyticum sp. I15G10I2]|uniref:30S ribosomal protein S1 n=1 Tax=Cellulosilyticum sp. I15G10I2 TaxID=1892843 RepID=UPI00085C1EB1|nr:30S ribosomal protein S1 [Cellulosilyticum sp. I15G10I2]